MMDPGEVRQVVMNLVTNAWEAIGNEEGTVGIAVRAVSGPGLFEGFNPTGEMPGQGPWICLEVRDSGPGMDQKTLDRLFDPFFSTKFTGRGLGMAVTIFEFKIGGDAAIRCHEASRDLHAAIGKVIQPRMVAGGRG